ncbi:ABC transporter permease [Microbacterium sp. Root53]|uniref:ABC transporter permease n=1 Tax=Microbacterium sp. Root53 TaxID=1736553 RepID=UPI0006F4855A|nr:iron ABC transporter permease [Microbacterium sp. Root53]KQZ11757.1 ABC transporter permease [Microbacterium sp. Root53]
MTATLEVISRTKKRLPRGFKAPATGPIRNDEEPGTGFVALVGRLMTPKTLILAVVALVIFWFGVVPLWFMASSAFSDPLTGEFIGLEGFIEAYADTKLFQMLGHSLWFAAASSVLAVVVGTTLAYLLVRTDVPLKSLFFASSIIPLVIPGILYTVAWIFLADKEIGLLNHYLGGAGLFDINTVWGMAWVEGLHLSPIVFLLMVAAFRAMDPSLEESATMSGASRATVIRKITLPLVLPALVGAIVIMIVRALESFEVPALLGVPANIYVFTSQIYFELRGWPPGTDTASALAFGLLAIALIGVTFSNLISRNAKKFQTITGKAFRPRPIELGKWRPLAGTVILAYFLVTVILPMAVLLFNSFLPYPQAPSAEAFASMTFQNYLDVFDIPAAPRALTNSLILGLSAATACMAFMAVASWITVRTKLPGRQLIDAFTFVPMVIPGLIMGVALLSTYLWLDANVGTAFYGTLWLLGIAYFTRYMPYGMRYAVTSQQQIGAELEESALMSGASWWQTFRRVLLPLLMPGLLSGWIYILVVSFRELSSSILLYKSGTEVLGLLIWEQWENGSSVIVAAIGVLMVLTLIVMVSIAYKLGAKVGIQQD